jgi:hypothetical protein
MVPHSEKIPMDIQLFYSLCTFVAGIPYLVVAAILAHFVVRRALSKRHRRRGKSGFYPSSAALGMVFLLAQTFYRPSLQHFVNTKQVIEVEEDDQGDPETSASGLDRQLKRLRRGEPLHSLVLRL